MKASFKFILAALAATVTLAGCTKEISTEKAIINPASAQAEGSRVIAVSFAPQTKTTLDKDGLTPNFVNGDKILVANGQDEPDTCVVSVNGGKATITTNLTGPLNAVYPAKAAKMDSDNPNRIVGVLIPSSQTGKFADANICMEENITNEAVFENKTAILRFYVDKSIGVSSIEIDAGTPIAEEEDNSYYTSIFVETDDESTLDEVTDDPGKRICYVAIKSGINANTLKFSSYAETQDPKLVTRNSPVDTTLNPGTMYNAFIPYYIQVGDQKWGYCNVGAFYPEDPGYYFSWGNVDGHRLNGADDSYLFDNNNYKETQGAEVMEKLTPESDAARQFWGPSYRVPTIEDFNKTFGSPSFWVSHNFQRIIGGFFIETESSELFLPAAGYYDMKGTPSFLEYDNEGRYWTSLSSDSDNASIFCFGESILKEQIACRYEGHPIRPIYAGPAPAPEKPTSLSGVFTVGEGKAVRFSRGNLYWDGTSSPGAFKFETEQYNYRLYPGKASDYAFLDKSTVTPVNTVGSFWWIKNGETAGTPYFPEYNIKTELCSGNDILFTNETATTPNTDFTVNGDEGVWRALSGGSGGEWEYLLEKRKDAAEKVGTATVNGVTGTILLPDTFTDPSVNSAFGGGAAFVPLDSIPEDMNFGDNIYDLDSWKKMESEGAVFLPAAGHVQTDVDKNQTKCHYWSSSALTGLTSYSIMIDLTNSPGHYGENSYLTSCQSPRSTLRIPVRLVTDAPVAGSTVEDLTVKDEDTDNWQ